MESVMKELIEDVIIKILLRLSVKSLLQFRCVCKAWCNLIKSPDFINMHLNRNIAENDHHILIKRCLEDKVTNVLSFHSNDESLSIVLPDQKVPLLNVYLIKAFCLYNGLVCISDYKNILLCNPAIKEFTLLPERPFGCAQDVQCYYDGLGFGFDADTNDYKVIRIVNLMDDDDYEFHVFKAELYRRSTDSWIEVDYDMTDLWHITCFEIFFHGATYWEARHSGYEKFLAFNMTTEMFQEFDFPDECYMKDTQLTVLNESIALLSHKIGGTPIDQQYIDVWLMREYGVSEFWTKRFTIGPLSNIEHPITFWNNFSLLLVRTNGQLISCAFDTDEIKELKFFESPRTLWALVYKESLISMKK